jgi:gluconokinase
MIIVLMGVTGSGKTTVGKKLAERLGWQYFDADEFHSPANVEKMKSGVALNDEDRKPWLKSLQRLVRTKLAEAQPAVLSCSALRQSYRDMLRLDARVRLVYLKGDYDLIKERLRARSNHYMNPALLDSQFATLEEPEDALTLDVESPPESIVETIKKHFDIQGLT